MNAPSALCTSRRSFLKLSAAVVAAALALPAADEPLSPPGLRIQSALPLPGYGALPFPEQLLTQPRAAVDAALVPAYVAALLIQRGLLTPLHGPSGRAHDPEGLYTVPYALRLAAIRFRSESQAPKTASWADLWACAGRIAFPASGRLLAGAALLRRGYSPNDVHPGHLAQAAADLKQLRPRLSAQGAELFDNRDRTRAALALVLADPLVIGQANGLRLPAEGTMLIEYDWVITAGAARADLARRFVEQFRTSARLPRLNLPVRLIPLMPLPEAARAQHAEIWAMLGV